MAAHKFKTQTQRHVVFARKQLRQNMERIALSHRGCPGNGYGCGCLVDKALTILTQAERDLFNAEIRSYADPTTPKRQINDDGTIESSSSKD